MAKLINWHDFELKLKEKQLLLFSASDISKVFPISKIAITFLLHRYSKKGFIVRIKQGLYVFPDTLPPDLYIANKLYEPSYISLEFALSYHRIIPETVYEITSVTPKATRHFETLGKIYSYRSITRQAFTGYGIQKQKGFSFAIADAEKALVDTIYYRSLAGEAPISRFNKDRIEGIKALKYAALFHNSKLIGMVKAALR